jgi:FKBP-type peptidyl-prolyl cis-trans isomerase FklB
MKSSSLLLSPCLRVATLVICLPAALLLAACGKSEKSTPPATGKLESIEQRASYGIGYNVGSSLARQQGLTIDQAAFQTGLADALGKQKLRVDESVIQAAFQELDQRVAKQAAEAGKTNLAAAAAFLEKNRTRKEVTTTASGLQYEVLKKGTGAKPTATSRVSVHYHGTLLDGTVFDSSVERKEPAEFTVDGVIPGWTEALQLMSVGDKWKVYVPPAIGYGPNPRPGGGIPPNAALIFEVELLEIK